MGAADRPKRDRNPAKKEYAPVQPPKPTRPTGLWGPSRILTRNSGVVTADIRAFLLTCVTGWDNYTIDEQREIINTLPKSRRFHIENPATGKLTCPLDAGFVANDAHLKRATLRFTDDVAEGHYTPSWQIKARQAMQERAEGRFDEYLKQHAEDRFGGDDSSLASERTGDERAAASNHNDEAEQGQAVEDESSDGEWDPAAKFAGSRSGEQGDKRKIRPTMSPDSSPDPIRPASTRSRISTPTKLAD
jgi:hypothetical protein